MRKKTGHLERLGFMRRICTILLSVLVFVCAVAGCNSPESYVDGTYTAEVAHYDSYGYKDFLVVTVEEGAVANLVFDGRSPEGALRSEDERYRQEMEVIQSTYPAQYSADLVNQYMLAHDIEKVEIVAGATLASNNFKQLFAALLPQMEQGNTTPVQLDGGASS